MRSDRPTLSNRATFRPGTIRPDQVLLEFERFYARLCHRFVNNYDRPSKRHLLPFAIVEPVLRGAPPPGLRTKVSLVGCHQAAQMKKPQARCPTKTGRMCAR